MNNLLFKYRSGDEFTLAASGKTILERDLQSLMDSTFYCAQRATLNDPFEGVFDRAKSDFQLDQIHSLLLSIAPSSRASFEAVKKAVDNVLSFVDKSGVYSLSRNPLSELIWAHYGNSHKGFCLGYDVEKLISFDPINHTFIDVIYRDTCPSITIDDFFSQKTSERLVQKILGFKSKAWSYEEEVRIVSSHSGVYSYDYRALKKVYFGLRCSEATRKSVMKVLAGRNVTYEQVEIKRNSYLLTSRKIPDDFHDAEIYKSNIAPIADCAVITNGLNSEEILFEEYLHKAVEIVRRDPYCIEVIQSSFSSTKRTPKGPSIFVTYERSDKRIINYELTLEEIDVEHENLNFS